MPPVMPIDLVELIVPIMGILVVLIPVTGLTARFALKPIVEAVARMRESQGTNQALVMLERRMNLLEQEMQGIAGLREDVAKLVEAQEFQLKLATPEKETTGNR